MTLGEAAAAVDSVLEDSIAAREEEDVVLVRNSP